MLIGKSAAVAAIALSMIECADAEPASADPTFMPPDGRPASPVTLSAFRLAGANLSLAARGRRVSIDTRMRLENFKQARAMSKVFPGYPQPAILAFDLHVWF